VQLETLPLRWGCIGTCALPGRIIDEPGRRIPTVIASTVALHNGCPGGASWGRAWWTTREPTLLRYLAYILSQARHLPLLGSSPEALTEWRRGGENGESRATPRFLPVPPAGIEPATRGLGNRCSPLRPPAKTAPIGPVTSAFGSHEFPFVCAVSPSFAGQARDGCGTAGRA